MLCKKLISLGSKLSAVCIALALAFVACADTYVWKGAGGAVNWENVAKWTNTTAKTSGTLPGDSDTVEFWAARTYADFTVSPPASFTGTIKAMGNADNDETALDDMNFAACVKIVNTNNATFTVGGKGSLVAFDGIAAMLDSSFTSVIDIPAVVKLIDAAGEEVPLRRRSLTISTQGVTLGGIPGLAIVYQ